jgi:uncharacterized membrane protein YfcA
MLVLFLGLGCVGGLVSGFLGIGGAIVMIPLMLACPPLFGFPELSMQAVAGLSIIQVLAASISGLLRYGKHGLVDRRALLLIGLPMAAFALAGALLSRALPGKALLVVFGALGIAALALMLRKPPASGGGVGASLGRPLSLAIGSAVGLISGMVGVGGGFILMPLMIYFLGMPTKAAVGTSLGIVLLGSVAGAAGKVLAGHVDWALALALVLGAAPAAQLGAILGRKAPEALVRALLALAILASCAQAWWKALA